MWVGRNSFRNRFRDEFGWGQMVGKACFVSIINLGFNRRGCILKGKVKYAENSSHDLRHSSLLHKTQLPSLLFASMNSHSSLTGHRTPENFLVFFDCRFELRFLPSDETRTGIMNILWRE
jgi:hypothetical protein